MSYGRPVSIGDASALFGGGAGGGDDFFGGSGSKRPGFGTVQEEEEPTEQASYQQQPYQSAGGHYQQPAAQGGYYDQQQAYGGQQYAQQPNAQGGWQDQSYEANQTQYGYASSGGQAYQPNYGGGADPYGSTQYQQQYQQPQQPQQPQQESYGGYQSQGVFSSGVAAPAAYDPYGRPQQAPARQPYSPPPTSTYQAPPARSSSIPPGSQGASTAGATKPAPVSRVQTYDAYDPPPMRRKSTNTLNRSVGVKTPPLPVGSPLSFGQALHGSQGPSATASVGSPPGMPPPPPKKKGTISRPGSTQPNPPSRPQSQQARRDVHGHQQSYNPSQYSQGQYDYRADQTQSPAPQPAPSQYDPYANQYQQPPPPSQQQYYPRQSSVSSPPPTQQQPSDQWYGSQQPPSHQQQPIDQPSYGGYGQPASQQYQQTPSDSYNNQAASDPYADYAAETGQNYDDYEQMAEAFAQGQGQQATTGYDASGYSGQPQDYQGYGDGSYDPYADYGQGQQPAADSQDVEGGGWGASGYPTSAAPPAPAPAVPASHSALESEVAQAASHEDFLAYQATQVEEPPPTQLPPPPPPPRGAQPPGPAPGAPPAASKPPLAARQPSVTARQPPTAIPPPAESRSAPAAAEKPPPRAATAQSVSQTAPAPAPAARPGAAVPPPPTKPNGPPAPRSAPAPAPTLSAEPNGETVADFQASIGRPASPAKSSAGPDPGLTGAAKDPSIVKTLGFPQSSQPEPDAGQGDSSTLDSSQRLKTPPPPPKAAGARSASPTGSLPRVQHQLSPPRAKDTRPTKASPLRSIVPLAVSPVDEAPPLLKPEGPKGPALAPDENKIAPPAALAEPKLEAEEEEDAWGFDEELDAADAEAGLVEAHNEVEETPEEPVSLPKPEPRYSEPLAIADDIDDAWGLEDEVIGLDSEPKAPEAEEVLPLGRAAEDVDVPPPPIAAVQQTQLPSEPEAEPEPDSGVEVHEARFVSQPDPEAHSRTDMLPEGRDASAEYRPESVPGPDVDVPVREATPPPPPQHAGLGEPKGGLSVPTLNILPATPEPIRHDHGEQVAEAPEGVASPPVAGAGPSASAASFDVLADLGEAAQSSDAQQPYGYEEQQYDPNAYGAQYAEDTYGTQPYADQQPYGDQASYGDQQYGNQASYSDQQYGDQQYDDQQHGDKQYNDYGYPTETPSAEQGSSDPYAPQTNGRPDDEVDPESYAAGQPEQSYGGDGYNPKESQQDFQYGTDYNQPLYDNSYGTATQGTPSDHRYGEESYSAYAPSRDAASLATGERDIDPYNGLDSAYSAPLVNGKAQAQTQGSSFGEDQYGYGFGMAAAAGAGAADAVLQQTDSYGSNTAIDDAYAPLKSASIDAQGPDPLERQRANLAIVSFGFGGKLLTTFPTAQDSYSGAVGLLNIPPITLRKLKDIVPSTTLEAYPGPLFLDGGSKASAGKKRKEIVGWLDSRIDEAEKRCSYLQGVHQMSNATGSAGAASDESSRAVERTILLKLLKVLVENEGKLSGQKVEDSVRSILAINSGASGLSKTSVTLPTADQLHVGMLGAVDGLGGGNDSSPTIATYTVRASSLDKLEELLAHGQREAALSFALDKQMWGHAMVIANTLGGSSWNEAVQTFARSELGDAQGKDSKSRASLRALYGLFAGGGGAALEQFLPPQQLSPAPFAPPRPSSTAPALLTPTGPRSRAPTPAPPPTADYRTVGNVPEDVLRDWRTAVALVVANRVAGDGQFLMAIGDTLLANGRVDAAHSCYLLASSNVIGGSDNPVARIVLVGSALRSEDVPDYEAIMLTEVVEFALSLATVIKGQEPFPGLPHLQGFKLALAQEYVACGLAPVAQRYCDAMTATLKLATKSSPYYHPPLLVQLKALSDRLVAGPAQDKGASWISRKMQRPTLDSVWSTVEGRFSKFVAGDNEPPVTPTNPRHETASRPTLGPFSHYSSISPAGSTGTLSRAQSSSDLLAAARAQAPHPAPAPTPPPVPAPAPPPTPSSKAPPPTSWKKGHHQRSSSLGTHGYQYDPHSVPSWGTGYSGGTLSTPMEASPDPGASEFEPEDAQAQTEYGGAWWGSSEGAGSGAPPPTFQSFETDGAQDTDGLIDPMGGYKPQQAGSRHDYGPYRQQPTTLDEVDEEDDLGLGNSKSKRTAAPDAEPTPDEAKDGEPEAKGTTQTAREPAPAKKADAPNLKPMPSSSWIGRWFKRDAAGGVTPGPIKANLGEDVSLVYDPETKRWISKKAGGATPSVAPTPPPPPSRAQTASPTTAMRGRSLSTSPAPLGPPPPRSMGSSPALGSTPDFSKLPPPPPLPKSALSGPPTPLGTPPPPAAGSAPPTGPRKSGAKKPIRSRYVEIK